MAYKNQYEEPCTACGKPTHETCDECKQPFDSGCLFRTGKALTLPCDPDNEDYAERPTWNRAEEVCLACYIAAKKHPPLILWQGTSAETTLSVFVPKIEKGVISPAGDDFHSWYKLPIASKMLILQWGAERIELDTFRVLQLLNFLKTNEELIRIQAQATSDILVPHARKMTEQAIRADLGIVDEQESEA